MKFIQKAVLPLLLAAIVIIIYTIYFAPDDNLGSFSSFDTNNNANKDIRVSIVKEKGINQDVQNKTASFYAVDKNGIEVLIQAPLPLPSEIENLNSVILKGHLHPDHFHSIEVSE